MERELAEREARLAALEKSENARGDELRAEGARLHDEERQRARSYVFLIFLLRSVSLSLCVCVPDLSLALSPSLSLFCCLSVCLSRYLCVEVLCASLLTASFYVLCHSRKKSLFSRPSFKLPRSPSVSGGVTSSPATTTHSPSYVPTRRVSGPAPPQALAVVADSTAVSSAEFLASVRRQSEDERAAREEMRFLEQHRSALDTDIRVARQTLMQKLQEIEGLEKTATKRPPSFVLAAVSGISEPRPSSAGSVVV